VYTLAGLGFSREFAEQDALDRVRHFVGGFFPVDALDEGFGAGRLSVVVHRRHLRGNLTTQGQDARNVTNEERKACRYAPRTEQASLSLVGCWGLSIFVQVLEVS